MSSARVQNIDALKNLRVALVKFADAAKVALGDAEGEVQRTVGWLQSEQPMFWQSQIRKRHELVNRCKEAVRQKKIFKDSAGRTQSAVDEEKQLRAAMKKFEEAEQKLQATKRHASKLGKEMHMYKGATQTFATCIASDVPNAIAALDRMIHALEAYVSLRATSGLPETAEAPATVFSMGNDAGDDALKQPEEGEAKEAEAAPMAEAAVDSVNVEAGGVMPVEAPPAEGGAPA